MINVPMTAEDATTLTRWLDQMQFSGSKSDLRATIDSHDRIVGALQSALKPPAKDEEPQPIAAAKE